jgi:hypothetical protein
VGLAGISGSGLSLVRSRACRPCRCPRATLLRDCSTRVGTSGGVERAIVGTGRHPVGRLLSRANEKADDEPDSWVLDESLSPDRLPTRSLGRGTTATLADAIDDETHYHSSLSWSSWSWSTAQSLVEMGKVENESLISLSIVFRHLPGFPDFGEAAGQLPMPPPTHHESPPAAWQPVACGTSRRAAGRLVAAGCASQRQRQHQPAPASRRGPIKERRNR